MSEAIRFNPDDLARELGVPEKKINLPDGRTMVEYDWTMGNHLGEAADKVKGMLSGSTPVEIMGHGPAWLFGALTCAVWPNEVSVFVNPLQALVEVVTAPFGENPEETKVTVELTGDGEKYELKIEEQPIDGAANVPEMISYYREHYKAVKVPEIPDGKILCVEAKAVNFVAMSVLRAYICTCKAIYVKNFGEEQYTCVYTAGSEHTVGEKL